MSGKLKVWRRNEWISRQIKNHPAAHRQTRGWPVIFSWERGWPLLSGKLEFLKALDRGTD
jgi:hypothetical protein